MKTNKLVAVLSTYIAKGQRLIRENLELTPWQELAVLHYK